MNVDGLHRLIGLTQNNLNQSSVTEHEHAFCYIFIYHVYIYLYMGFWQWLYFNKDQVLQFFGVVFFWAHVCKTCCFSPSL